MLSSRFLTWNATQDVKTCQRCRDLHGKIYEVGEWIDPRPPLHERCRCVIEYLHALLAGTATEKGTDGADWWLKYYGMLPSYYVTRNNAKLLGWNDKIGNLHEVLPGKMLIGGVYKNKDGHLPSTYGRVWYEVDINYVRGWRGLDRIVFSNDGLIFVTYDHYESFIEIV